MYIINYYVPYLHNASLDILAHKCFLFALVTFGR